MKAKIMKYIPTGNYLLRELYPKREKFTHKGNYGKVLLLCGSVGTTGAAVLAAKASCRSGSGLVYLGVPQSIYPIVAGRVLEAVVFPLEDNKTGHFLPENFESLKDRLTQMDAVLIGPGCGQSAAFKGFVKKILQFSDVPVVLDADAINVFRDDPSELAERKCPLILTPHDGEFSRIFPGAGEDRAADAVSLAKKLNAVVLRKGFQTIITDGTATYKNFTGNPGMAKGGSGDVLSGIMVSILGRNRDVLKASAGAVYLHGRAGDLAAEYFGMEGMLPSDMIDAIPICLKSIKTENGG